VNVATRSRSHARAEITIPAPIRTGTNTFRLSRSALSHAKGLEGSGVASLICWRTSSDVWSRLIDSSSLLMRSKSSAETRPISAAMKIIPATRARFHSQR
jgi:hypothetical protein